QGRLRVSAAQYLVPRHLPTPKRAPTPASPHSPRVGVLADFAERRATKRARSCPAYRCAAPLRRRQAAMPAVLERLRLAPSALARRGQPEARGPRAHRGRTRATQSAALFAVPGRSPP